MRKRYLEFDIARVLALVLMPYVHMIESAINCGIIQTETLQANAFIVKIASFGAFVFMCMLGVNLLLTRHNTPKALSKRGCMLLLMGMGLNVVRYIIPGILGALATGHYYLISGTVYYSIASDILYFSAFCFLFFAIAKSFKLKWYYVLLIGCILNLFDYYLPTPTIQNSMLGAFLGNFMYINEDSAFSFSQWFVVVCVGYTFGTVYLKQENKKRFYKRIMFASPALLAVTLLVCHLFHIPVMNEIGNQYENFNLSLLGVFILFLAYLFLQSIVYFISIKIKNQKAVKFIVNYSKGITIYYILQWIFVCWVTLIIGILGTQDMSGAGLAGWSALIMLVSTLLALSVQRKRQPDNAVPAAF